MKTLLLLLSITLLGSTTHAGYCAGIVVDTLFTQEFIDKYEYENAKGYNFAINIDGHYWNTFRNSNGGVSNSQSDGLTGAVPAYMFNEPVPFYIPFGWNKFANKKGYGYHMRWVDSSTYLSTDVYMSPVKEGVETHIMYVGYYEID